MYIIGIFPIGISIFSHCFTVLIGLINIGKKGRKNILLLRLYLVAIEASLCTFCTYYYTKYFEKDIPTLLTFSQSPQVLVYFGAIWSHYTLYMKIKSFL